ncbi:MAG: domain S-box protein [Solirubrobacterales bacterium]|nr:domain S-box protein [Solirubrobacterales bacterium]
MTGPGDDLSTPVEPLLREALATMADLSIVVFDPKMRIVSAQGGAIAKHGWFTDRIVGRRAPEVLPAPAWEQVGPLYARALRGETVKVELPTHDGGAIYETTFAPVRRDGRIVGGVASSADVTVRHRAEQELRRSEREFRQLAESAADVVTRSAPDGTVLYVSPAARAVFGVDPHDRAAAKGHHGVHPEDRAGLAATREAVLADGVQRQAEYRFTRPDDGREVWLQTDLRAWRDPVTGVVTELHGATRDITRRRADDELRRQWERAFATDPRGIALADPATSIVRRVNPAFAAMHGGTREEFVGASLRGFTTGPTRERMPSLREVVAGGGRVRYEADHVRLDGTVFPVAAEAVAATGGDDHPLYRICFVTDLTEAHARQASERRAHEGFERVFAEAPVGMVVLRDGRVERANTAFAAMVGLDTDALCGRTLAEFLDPDGPVPPLGPAVQDRRLRSADGLELHLRLRSSVLQDAQGEPLVLVHLADRTAEVLANEELRRASALFETSFSGAPIGMCLVGLDGRFLRVNDALCALLGRSADELRGLGFEELTHPDDPRVDLALLDEALAGRRSSYEFEKRYRTADGRWVACRLSVALVRDDEGRPRHFISQIIDLTALQEAQGELAHVNARLQAILDHSPTAIYMRDLEQRWVVANAETGRITGTPGAVLVGNAFADTHPEVSAKSAADDAEVLRTGEPMSFDETATDVHTGTEHHFWSLKFPVRDADGTVVGLGGVSVDVTERERDARELAKARALFQTVFAGAPMGMLVSQLLPGRRTAVLECNEAFAAMTGRVPEDLIGQDAGFVVHPDDLPDRQALLEDMAAGRPTSRELRLQHLDGHDVWALVVPTLVPGPDGERLAVLHALDISERKRFEGRLQHLADHDALTGLFGRRRFEEELEREVTRVRRTAQAGVLLMLDLDGFKYVNDAFGHSTGDQLITRLGAALGGALRDTDVLARIGGDEFAAILPATDLAGGRLVAQELVETVRAHGRVIVGGGHAEVTASVGVTTIGGTPDLAGELLLVEADIAMYEAKDSGKDRIAVYDRADGRREQLSRRTDWIGRLRRAIAKEQFVLLAQPIIPLAAAGPGREHYELLLRLVDDDGRLVPPGTFLYHAERHGLVGDIDRWVLGQAVRALHAAHAAGRHVEFAVNLSARTIQDLGIAEHLAELLREHPVPPGTLMIEVTETAAITNVSRAAELARQLQGLGCQLALDDFGAGFASFYYLKHLVFDVLKIDGDFIDRLPTSTTDQLVVRAVVDIARGLGAKVVAERVGDAETVSLLRDLGVDYGQGYFLGRPRRLADLI